MVVLYIQGKGHIEKDAPIRMPDQVETAIREYLRARKEFNSQAFGPFEKLFDRH